MWKVSSSKPTKTTYRGYSPTALTNAYLSVIKDGVPIRQAARVNGVPEATIRDRVHGRIFPDTVSSGPQPLFTQEQEAHLVDHIKLTASLGYGYSRAEVLDTATDYATHLGIRDHDHPMSMQWYKNFMWRWPDIQLLKPRGLALQRAKATSAETVDKYFKQFENILTKYNLKSKPERIYNVDEKGLNTSHKSPNVVAAVGATPPAINSGTRQTVTVLGCGNAQGNQVPPYFVFPAKRFNQDLMKGATTGAAAIMSDNGWSNTAVFQKYLQEHLIRYLPERTPDSPVLLLYDGHTSHISLPTIDWAKQQNIILFVLPAHTSHVLQPLDIGCFWPFEHIFNNESHKHMRLSQTKVITRFHICELGSKACVKALQSENLQASFRRAGIYPFNSDVVSKNVYLPSTVFIKETDENDLHKTLENTHTVNHEVTSNKTDSEHNNNYQKLADNTTQHTDNLNFFEKREDGLFIRKSAKKRNYIGNIVGGNCITETDIVSKIKEHKDQHSKMPKNTKKTKMSQTHTDSQIPGRSSVEPNDKLSKSAKFHTLHVDSSEDDIDDDETCCVCGLFQPEELKRSVGLVFTQWGQCMYGECTHWVHLITCCDVRVLRTHATLYCPCHGVPCKPEE